MKTFIIHLIFFLENLMGTKISVIGQGDTYRSNSNENLGCLFLYIYFWSCILCIMVIQPFNILVLAGCSTHHKLY